MDAVEEFQKHRSLLLGLAYRLLGSMWDAEDVVQDAYLRWMRVNRAEIRDTRSFLVTVVARLALDQLRSARVTREAYPGPWLPEPVRTDMLEPLDTVELRDSVSFATLHMMERLSPPERAVFVLRSAFNLRYADIAEIVGSSVAGCRQTYSRALRRLSDGRGRFQPSTEDHIKLLRRFLEAAQSGDLRGLTELLSDEVTAWNDGGGKVRAALRPIIGRDKVVAFVIGLTARYPFDDVRLVQANGHPAVALVVDGQDQLVIIDIYEGRIRNIFAVLNPDKLAFVRQARATS